MQRHAGKAENISFSDSCENVNPGGWYLIFASNGAGNRIKRGKQVLLPVNGLPEMKESYWKRAHTVPRIDSVKESKLNQNRELDTRKRLTWWTYLMAFPPKKRGAPAHQQQNGWVHLILMPGCLNNWVNCNMKTWRCRTLSLLFVPPAEGGGMEIIMKKTCWASLGTVADWNAD